MPHPNQHDPDALHVVPVFEGEPEHEASTDCWCEPELAHRNDEGREVWTHHRPQ